MVCFAQHFRFGDDVKMTCFVLRHLGPKQKRLYMVMLRCFFSAAVCIKDTRKVISGGKTTRKLVYRDQVVELTYEDGDTCAANPALKHKSIFSFICKSEGGGTDEPVLVYSDDTTCTHFFSWHTSLVCEQQVRGGL